MPKPKSEITKQQLLANNRGNEIERQRSVMQRCLAMLTLATAFISHFSNPTFEMAFRRSRVRSASAPPAKSGTLFAQNTPAVTISQRLSLEGFFASRSRSRESSTTIAESTFLRSSLRRSCRACQASDSRSAPSIN